MESTHALAAVVGLVLYCTLLRGPAETASSTSKLARVGCQLESTSSQSIGPFPSVPESVRFAPGLPRPCPSAGFGAILANARLRLPWQEITNAKTDLSNATGLPRLTPCPHHRRRLASCIRNYRYATGSAMERHETSALWAFRDTIPAIDVDV